MNFAVINLGCKVNRVESDAIVCQLLNGGACESVSSAAEVIVVNTCTVTGEAEKKTRKAVRVALKANDFAHVIVTGCAAAINASVFEEMSPRVEVVGKASLPTRLDDLLSELGVLPTSTMLTQTGSHHSRIGVKVQDGCNHACSYCIVHVARGKSVSTPVDEAVNQCVSLARAGVREIVLTGIDLASYCSVQANGEIVGLSGLLKQLLSSTLGFVDEAGRACRFRIGSVEPMSIDDDFIDCMKQNKGRICWHLHLPLQSGSTKVLSEMNRPYSTEAFCEITDKLYEAMPSLSLSTDIIVGFPGETDDDFKSSCDIARRCKFSKIHVFPYSQRKGTPAAERVDQIPAPIIRQRAQAMRELAQTLRKEQRAIRVGSTELAVVEDKGVATTDSYFEVPAPVGAKPGALVSLTL